MTIASRCRGWFFEPAGGPPRGCVILAHGFGASPDGPLGQTARRFAAAGIAGFSRLLKFVEQTAPLRRNVTIDEVGNVAAFLLSDLASGITGEITYVDAGFSTVAAGIPEE